MKSILKFLFPLKPDDTAFSLFLLALRILLGVLLMTHGINKLTNFVALQQHFPDPIGLGRSFALGFAIFSELACAIGFILGAFYRLALIPMFITMFVVFFVIHAGDPFLTRELPFIYLVIFILMFITGPGKYSLDRFIAETLSKDRDY